MENLVQMLLLRCQKTPHKTAYQIKENKQWKSLSWSEVDKISETLAAGLIGLGLEHGDKAAILGTTQLNWALCDLAVLRCGAVGVGVYPTLTGEQSHYILLKSESKILFVDSEEQLDKLIPFLDNLPDLKKVILWKGKSQNPLVKTLEELKEIGKKALNTNASIVKDAEAKIQASDLVVLIFTSGTTGHPKAAAISHANILAELQQLDLINENDTMLFFLPMAHVGERIAGHYNRILYGVPASFVEDITLVIEAIKEIKPTFFGSVPRIFEKIYTKVQSQVATASDTKKKVFHWASQIGKKVAQKQDAGEKTGLLLGLQHQIADALVLKKIRNLFGGRVRYCVSSAAPISVEILAFFRAAGITILEGYGQTESTGFATLNSQENLKFGSVGKALPEVQIKIAEDGEVLIKGSIVFQGYFKDEEKTKETINDEGWLLTGDLGKLDEEGYLYITGRKKDIIITSGGKNVTPSNIEALLTNHPLIEQALVHGDCRNYLTALIAIAPDSLTDWAKKQGFPQDTVENLKANPVFIQEIQGHIDQINQSLARYETIKKFAFLPRLLDIENGEITPTLKIKRNVVEQKYKDLLDGLYL